MENELLNMPLHVAVIPDGNRRWAKGKGLQPWEGHEIGAKNFEKIVKRSLEKGIRCLSIWGSSTDNLSKRPMEEKKALLDIYQRYFKRLLESKEIHENEVKNSIIGRWEEQFPESLKKIIYEAMEKTKHYKKRMLNLLLAYSGTDEMVEAVKKINDKYEKGAKITAEMIKENLMTKDLPPVDLLVRTGGEPHNSTGFMMWDLADAQYYFSDILFPDFDDLKYEEALQEYARRQRRFGK
jgi:undecaprenyl diphosphate synthase